MDKTELIERLDGYEWNDIEFKEARRDVPRNAYETVSAFANTEGGHLVFGVRQDGDDFEAVGVQAVDKVQSDFLTTLQQANKISAVLGVREELHRHGDADLLVFHVPEASRADKPVYLDGNINRAFVRKGGNDFRCSVNERDRFLVDAAPERFDGRIVERNLDTAFDSDCIRWYRQRYESRPGNQTRDQLSDLEFLDDMGLLAELDGRKVPTRAAVLLFGCNGAFRQLVPRPVVDCQRFSQPRARADTGMRWRDRLVLDENLIRSWRASMDWYDRLAEHPFRIDPATLQRDDTPPDYVAFREALINLLIHQDYSDQGRKAEVRHYADQTVFWNPGDAFAAAADLLEPGEKELRNPRIVTAFRRIGLSENAGWGLRDVFRNWQQLGNVPPSITNDKSRKCFEIVLLREELLSERQRGFQARLGVRLTHEQARAFAFVCREGEATLTQLRAVIGRPAAETVAVADALVAQGLVERSNGGGHHVLAEHLQRRLDASDPVARDPSDAPAGQAGPERHGLVTDQAGREATRLVTDQPSPEPERLVSDQPHLTDLKGNRLVTDQAGPEPKRLVTDQPSPEPGRLVTDQAPMPADLDDAARKIVAFCQVPRSMTEIMDALGMTHRTYFRRNHLEPLLASGVLRMSHPDQPNHPDQAYALTEAGAALNAHADD